MREEKAWWKGRGRKREKKKEEKKEKETGEGDGYKEGEAPGWALRHVESTPPCTCCMLYTYFISF